MTSDEIQNLNRDPPGLYVTLAFNTSQDLVCWTPPISSDLRGEAPHAYLNPPQSEKDPNLGTWSPRNHQFYEHLGKIQSGRFE